MTSAEVDSAVIGITELVNNTIVELVSTITIPNQAPFPIPDGLKHLISEKKKQTSSSVAVQMMQTPPNSTLATLPK